MLMISLKKLQDVQLWHYVKSIYYSTFEYLTLRPKEIIKSNFIYYTIAEGRGGRQYLFAIILYLKS